MTLKIGTVSKLTGFSPSGIRYYEDKGIINPSHGRNGTYRSFDFEDVALLLECRNLREADYMHAIENGPYYVFEYNPGAWVTLGGIKTDGFCRAVNSDNDIVDGLYVAGVDGDFWSVPYFQGGSCNGLSLASGALAGKTAAKDVL